MFDQFYNKKNEMRKKILHSKMIYKKSIAVQFIEHFEPILTQTGLAAMLATTPQTKLA